jgi:hypothetical protein
MIMSSTKVMGVVITCRRPDAGRRQGQVQRSRAGVDGDGMFRALEGRKVILKLTHLWTSAYPTTPHTGDHFLDLGFFDPWRAEYEKPLLGTHWRPSVYGQFCHGDTTPKSIAI